MNRLSSKPRIALVVLCALAFSASVLFLLRRRAEAVPSKATAGSASVSDNSNYRNPKKIASLKDSTVKESSGIVASRTTPGLYWTHNDSGDGPFLYTFDERGQSRGVWKVNGAKARDWEAIAAGPGPDSTKNYLYIGDIGDNGERRPEIMVYRVSEPTVTSGDEQSTRRKPLVTEAAEIIRLRYPDGPHDAEALLVHPRSGNLYVVTKQVFGDPHIYEAAPPLNAGVTVTLRHLGQLDIPSMFGGIITDGAISPDGMRVVLCDYLRGYELVLTNSSVDFNTIWKQPFATIDLGSRKQGEAITYRLDGRALLATSEGSPAPLLQIQRR
jgi:hypothetical protein